MGYYCTQNLKMPEKVVYSAVKHSIKRVNYARSNTVCHWAGPTLYSFHIQMSKKRRRGCRRVYRSKSRESWCRHERRRKECRWEVQAAHRCQPALCLRANGGVTLTRQGRGVQTSSCTTGAAVTLSAPSLPRFPSLFMPCVAERTRGDGHNWGDGRSDLAWFKSWYFSTGGCENAKVSWGLRKVKKNKQTKSPGRFKCSFNCVLWWPDGSGNCYSHTSIMHET